jgi:hypothetical protein
MGPIKIGLGNITISHDITPKRIVECNLAADVINLEIMGWKLNTAVKIELSIVFVSVGQCGANVDSLDPDALAVVSPYSGSPPWVGQVLRPIYNKEWGPIEPNISRI